MGSDDAGAVGAASATTAPRKRGRRNEARWNEILTAAGMEFAEKGYSDTTIDDIAARVGLLSGSLYYYITSKEDLLFEWAARVHDRSIELTVEDEETAAADARTRLTRFLERWMDDIRHAQPADAYAVMDQEVRRLPAERVATLREKRHEFRSYVYSILEQGVAEGVFDPALEFRLVFNDMVRLLWSTSQWFVPGGEVSYEEVTAWYATFIIRGVGVGP